MKKIISLLASVAMLATMVTSVSAASIETNNPVVSTTIEEIDADAFYEFTELDLEEGVPYLITVDYTGLDLISEPGGDANGDGKVTTSEKNNRTGVLASSAQYRIDWDSEEHIIEIYDEIRDIVETPGFLDQTGKVNGTALYSVSKDCLPVAESASKTFEATEIRASSYIVVTDGTPVTGTVGEAALVLRAFTNGTATDSKNYDFTIGNMGSEVNGEKTTTVTLGTVDPDPDPDPDPVEEFEYRAKKELKDTDGETFIGYAWDLTINGFDSTKTYTATFTAGGETKTNELFLDGAEVKNGSIAFAALLKTAKTAVELVLAKN